MFDFTKQIMRFFSADFSSSQGIGTWQSRPDRLNRLLSQSVPASKANIFSSAQTQTVMQMHKKTHPENKATHNLICAQRGLYKKQWESSITLPPLAISHGVLKSNAFSNAGLWLVAGPSWLWYMSCKTREGATAAMYSRKRSLVSYKRLLLVCASYRLQSEKQENKKERWETEKVLKHRVLKSLPGVCFRERLPYFFGATALSHTCRNLLQSMTTRAHRSGATCYILLIYLFTFTSLIPLSDGRESGWHRLLFRRRVHSAFMHMSIHSAAHFFAPFSCCMVCGSWGQRHLNTCPSIFVHHSGNVALKDLN